MKATTKKKNTENFVELAERLFIGIALILDLFQSIRHLCNLLLILSGLCEITGLKSALRGATEKNKRFYS
jgi:hypothetical protein